MNSTAATPESFSDLKLAQRLQHLRQSRDWSLDGLAQATAISRATLSRFERAQTSPTATQLGRLCTAYGLTMSQLLSGMDSPGADLVPADHQPVWRDPSTGFVRRAVSPPLQDFCVELTQCQLPAGATITYDAPAIPGLEQHIWMTSGQLELTHDTTIRTLNPGDCLRFKLWGSTRFHAPQNAPNPAPAIYLVAVGRRPS